MGSTGGTGCYTVTWGRCRVAVAVPGRAQGMLKVLDGREVGVRRTSGGI